MGERSLRIVGVDLDRGIERVALDATVERRPSAVLKLVPELGAGRLARDVQRRRHDHVDRFHEDQLHTRSPVGEGQAKCAPVGDVLFGSSAGLGTGEGEAFRWFGLGRDHAQLQLARVRGATLAVTASGERLAPHTGNRGEPPVESEMRVRNSPPGYAGWTRRTVPTRSMARSKETICPTPERSALATR